MGRQDCLNPIVENIQRLTPLCVRIAQARFRNHEFPAASVDIFESFIYEVFLQAIDRFINAPDSFQSEAGTAAVFAQPSNIPCSPLSNQHQATTAASNADD